MDERASAWQITRMDDAELLACPAADCCDPREAATPVELTEPVPGYPGSTVADLAVHTAQVHLHKVAVLRTGE